MLWHLPDALEVTLSKHLDLSKSRLETLARLILGLLHGRTVNLSHVASQFSGSAQVASSYRRLQRFFQHVRLDGDWLAQVIVKILRIAPPWILCLDRTNWKVGRRDVNILMLAIVTRRLRIPLIWTILNKDGSSSQEECMELLQRYLALFDASSISWLLADREFIGSTWIRFLLEQKITFAIRMKENSLVQLQDGRTLQLKRRLATRGHAKKLRTQSGRLAAMDVGFDLPLTFAAKRLHDGEMLIVATNGPANRALNIYRKRWQIECLFGDSKSRGLNMEDTRLTNPDKLNTLLVIMTLAMAWVYATATTAKGSSEIKKRSHGYRYKSWFRLGFDLLRQWILHQPHHAAIVWTRSWPLRKIRPPTAGVV